MNASCFQEEEAAVEVKKENNLAVCFTACNPLPSLSNDRQLDTPGREVFCFIVSFFTI